MAAEPKKKAGGHEHKATYARDKRKGGWMIRVQGPHSNRFAGRTVPVTMLDNSMHEENLDKLIWTGKDQQTGDNVTLYTFKPKPKEEEDTIPF